jgi:hypothetical protein
MKIYLCRVEHTPDDPCNLQYREIEPGLWQARWLDYWPDNQLSGGEDQWVSLAEITLDEIKEIGHDPVEVVT